MPSSLWRMRQKRFGRFWVDNKSVREVPKSHKGERKSFVVVSKTGSPSIAFEEWKIQCRIQILVDAERAKVEAM